MSRKNNVLGLALALVMILLGITGGSVEATTINLVNANVSFTGGPPYGSVELTANPYAGTVTFVVTALTGPSDTLGKFGFNTDLDLSEGNFDTVPTNWTLGSGQMDGFGRFDWTIGSSAEADRINKAMIIISGLASDEASEDHFEIENSKGHMFAAHLFQPGLTGYIAASEGATVPEPATMFLLGSGLIALGGYGRKKFKR